VLVEQLNDVLGLVGARLARRVRVVYLEALLEDLVNDTSANGLAWYARMLREKHVPGQGAEGSKQARAIARGAHVARKKKSSTVAGDKGFRWNDDDFNLDSFGVEAPEREVFEMLAEMGRRPDEVNEEIRERYVKYLERMKKKKEKEAKKAKTEKK
jgi:hypothetical protein